MSKHPCKMLLLEVLLVCSQSQREETLGDLLFEQTCQNLERGLHRMLSSLSVPLLERLAEVEDLRETISQLETLETPAKFEGLSQEDLGQLGSQLPLPVTVEKGASAISVQCSQVFASQILCNFDSALPPLCSPFDLNISKVFFCNLFLYPD